MNDAVVGFVGVIVGGVLTGTFQLWLRWDVNRSEARVASRLMLHDVGVAQEQTISYLHRERDGDSDEAERYAFGDAIATWKDQRTTLARRLSNREWNDVAEALKLLEALDGETLGSVARPTDHAVEPGLDEQSLEAGALDLLYRNLMDAAVSLERGAAGRRHHRRVKREIRMSTSEVLRYAAQRRARRERLEKLLRPLRRFH